jgi:imidazole glycerol phosphate synthase subunit HisF
LARHYSDGGADELVFLDISATVEGAATMVDVVTRVADVLTIPFTVAGHPHHRRCTSTHRSRADARLQDRRLSPDRH